MNNDSQDAWVNVVGNLYQSIWGTHEEKVAVIAKWLTDIMNTTPYPIGVDQIVEQCSKKYKG